MEDLQLRGFDHQDIDFIKVVDDDYPLQISVEVYGDDDAIVFLSLEKANKIRDYLNKNFPVEGK